MGAIGSFKFRVMVNSGKKSCNSEIKFSFVVCTYNGEKTLSKTLESISLQTNKNYECIVINDGSTDNSLEIAKSFYLKIPNLKIISQENKGVAKALNEGVKNSCGLFFIGVDHDDTVSPNLLEELDLILVKYPQIDIIGFNSDSFPEEDYISRYAIDDRTVLYANDSSMIYEIACNKSRINATYSSTCISRKLLKNIPFLGHGFGADALVMCLVISRVKEIAHINKILYHRLNNPNSVSRSVGKEILIDYLERLTYYGQQLRNNGNHYDRRIFCYYYDLYNTLLLEKNSSNCKRLQKIGRFIWTFRNFLLPKDKITLKSFLVLNFPKFSSFVLNLKRNIHNIN